jgi:hypothetical protein
MYCAGAHVAPAEQQRPEIELADIVGRFGDELMSTRMLSSEQRRALWPLHFAALPGSAVTWMCVLIAVTSDPPTTRAEIGTVPSANGWLHSDGSTAVWSEYCRYTTFTWCSRCRASSGF